MKPKDPSKKKSQVLSKQKTVGWEKENINLAPFLR